MLNNIDEATKEKPMPESCPMTLEQQEAKSGEKKEKKHRRHRRHRHFVETLADGTTVKKYKKKKSLPDGSSVVKSVTKSVPPQSDSLHVIKKVRTKTKQTYLDGLSHTTTIVRELHTATDAPADHVVHTLKRHVSNLPDGSEVATSKEVKVLPGGNLSVVTIRKHTVKAETATSYTDENQSTTACDIAEKAPSKHAASVGLHVAKNSSRNDQLHNTHEAATPPESAEYSRQISHDFSLETLDDHADQAPIPCSFLPNIDGNDANNNSYLRKGLETIEGSTDAPLHDEYIPGNGNSNAKSSLNRNKSVETIDSSDQPMPLGHLQDLDDGDEKKKAAIPSRGVGAHFISPFDSMNDGAKAKLKAKEREKPPLLDIEVGRSCAIDTCEEEDEEQMMLENRTAGHHGAGHHSAGHLGGFLERLDSIDEPVPLHYASDTYRQDAGTYSPVPELLANDAQNSDKRNFIQRLFKVAQGRTPLKPKKNRDSMMSWRQSKASSKNRCSVDTKRSHKSTKDSDDEIISNPSPASPDYNIEGLAVATRVDPSLEEPIYDAIEYDPESKPPLYKNRRCRVYTAVFLLIFTIIVAFAVVYSTKKTKEEVSPTKVVYVTEAPTPRPTTDREALHINDLIEAKVLKGNAKFTDMDKYDPRLLAMDWILYKDELQLELSAPNLSQRYVLSLLAFQFDYMAWTSCGGDYSSSELTCEVENNETDTTEEYSRWLSGTDECEWYGVSCLDGKVRELNLPDNNLIGEIPPEISTLRNLDVLALNSNCLFGSLPTEFGSMTNLQKLNIQDNSLGGYLPEEFYSMSSLTHLNLAWQGKNERYCTSSGGDFVDLFVTSDGETNYGLEGELLQKIGSLRHLF
ncbi:hypothetical protein ACHAWO_007135 [Cyclotella atomus]|uniref:Leucine-rich repeat-containing N-terminal plant-type domain-containing protein n=1 Tax=Cyclotella atomus TaxID=382360 RepID=A0ABD3PQT7_9STRA